MSTYQSFSFVLSTIIFFSCSSKKQNSHYTKTLSLQYDTVQVLPDEFVDIAQYNIAFEKEIAQIFTASPQKISILTGKKGLKVIVNPGALEKEDGSGVDGKIKVKMIELTNTEDLFKSNASTVSNGRLLASGGSYFVYMECNGQKLHIKQGKSLQMQFPKLKKEEMELFYGQRNENGDMNWISANKKLIQEPAEEKEIKFTDYNALQNAAIPTFNIDSAKIYEKLDDPVYFYSRKMTIKELVDTINKNRARIYIDTLYTRSRSASFQTGNFNTTAQDVHKLYRLKTCRELDIEMVKKEAERIEKLRKEETYGSQKTLTEQMQQYYAPSDITSLGWMNCDRFYIIKEKAETYFDLPITFNKGSVNYFLMFTTINGLVNGNVKIDSSAISVGSLPLGQKTTIVAFTKSNGKVFHCKQEFVVEKGKSLKLDFKPISEDEMKKIFGKNVSM